MTHQHLLPLSQLDDYRVANGDPDVRRWIVNDALGERVGLVHDLIVDLKTLDVKFLDIALDRRATRRRQAESPPHVLVPLALIRLTADAYVVTLSQLTWETIATLPEYKQDGFSRYDERILLARLEWLADPECGADAAAEERWFTAPALLHDDDPHTSPYRVDGTTDGRRGGPLPPS